MGNRKNAGWKTSGDELPRAFGISISEMVDHGDELIERILEAGFAGIFLVEFIHDRTAHTAPGKLRQPGILAIRLHSFYS